VNVLVDTSIWSVALRRTHSDVNREEAGCRERLGRLIEEGRVEIIGPIRQEILSGLRRAQDFHRLRRYLRFFQDARLTADDYEEAARIHNSCRAAGIAGSPVDFLICSVAARRAWEIFTLDKDFDRYASRVPLFLHRESPQ
jgi:predicted nucleic acid-binding protein